MIGARGRRHVRDVTVARVDVGRARRVGHAQAHGERAVAADVVERGLDAAGVVERAVVVEVPRVRERVAGVGSLEPLPSSVTFVALLGRVGPARVGGRRVVDRREAVELPGPGHVVHARRRDVGRRRRQARFVVAGAAAGWLSSSRSSASQPAACGAAADVPPNGEPNPPTPVTLTLSAAPQSGAPRVWLSVPACPVPHGPGSAAGALGGGQQAGPGRRPRRLSSAPLFCASSAAEEVAAPV